MKRFFPILILVFLLAGCAREATVQINANINQPAVGQINEPAEESPIASENINAGQNPAPVQATVPSKLILPVAFAQQAPFGNWDALHEEACEEAAMIMAEKYFKKEKLDEIIMEAEIQKLVQWEEANGYQIDLTAQETVNILTEHLGLSAHLETETTPDRIKYEISQGNLIIIPAAGRELGNPNFQTPGPIYHMLVIKGYDGSNFITNDPGTRKGDGFKYKYNKLIAAIHDWNHDLAVDGMTDEEMNSGEQVMIVVEKP